MKDMSHNCGVCSFCLGKIPLNGLNSTLMWSYYADHHKGICLTYSFPENWFTHNKGSIAGISKVKYGTDLLTTWLINQEDEYSVTSADRDELTLVEKLLVEIITIKSNCWSYEDEARIIKQQAGRQEIDRSFLRQICFGMDTPESDIELVRNICTQFGYAVTFCQVRRGSEDFGLELIELT